MAKRMKKQDPEPPKMRKVRHIAAMIGDDWKEVPDDVKPWLEAMGYVDWPDSLHDFIPGVEWIRGFVRTARGRYNTKRSSGYFGELRRHITQYNKKLIEHKEPKPNRQPEAEGTGTPEQPIPQSDESEE